MKPGSSQAVLNMAAKLSLGAPVQRPRFGAMGSIVRKLRLFEDTGYDDNLRPLQNVQHSYQGPVQIFNGPVFSGGLHTTLKK